MRKFRGDSGQLIGGLFPAADINAQNVHIHVTNVTNVISAHTRPAANLRPNQAKRNGVRLGQKSHVRPPKLFRYYASCGALDSKIAYGLESDDLCAETVKSIGYTARQIGSTAHDMAHSACGIVEGVGEVTAGVGGVLKGAFYVVAGLLGKDLA